MPPTSNALRATYSHQNFGFQSDSNEKKTQYRRAISYNDYHTLHEEEPSEPQSEKNPTLSFSSTAHVSIPIAEPITTDSIIHREIKTGRQRFRWNLIFNLLVWIICPLPIWLPFVTNQLSIYILISIQAIFVFIWFIISILAGRNALILFR